MILTIVILSIVLALETFCFIRFAVKTFKNTKALKNEIEINKQSKDFHINQLKNRYKGGEEVDSKRNSRKM